MCCDPKHLKTTRPDRPCPLPSHNTGCYTQSPHRARPVLPWPVRAMRLRPSYCERGVFSHISSTYCTRPVRSWPVRVLRLCPSYCKRGVSSPLSYIFCTRPVRSWPVRVPRWCPPLQPALLARARAPRRHLAQTRLVRAVGAALVRPTVGALAARRAAVGAGVGAAVAAARGEVAVGALGAARRQRAREGRSSAHAEAGAAAACQTRFSQRR